MAKGKKSELQTCHCDLRNCHSRPPFTNCIWQFAKKFITPFQCGTTIKHKCTTL